MQSGYQARLKSLQTQDQLAEAFCQSKDINLQPFGDKHKTLTTELLVHPSGYLKKKKKKSSY